MSATRGGSQRRLSLLAALAFALLAVATVAAFVITQHLKSSPTVLQRFVEQRFFSPDGNGVQDRARLSFTLREADDITVFVIAPDGEVVRELAHDRHVGADRRVRLAWDGRGSDGLLEPDGLYTVRVRLRRLGRLLTVPQPLVLDTVPPKVVARVRPRVRSGPVVLPRRDGRGLRVRVPGSTPGPSLSIYSTDGARPRLVERVHGSPRRRYVRWDGRLGGAPAPPGSYLVAVRVRDAAGNAASRPAELPPRRGARPGGVGVTIRYVAARGPLYPVAGGTPVTFAVQTAARSWRWSVRRVGARRVRERGAGRGRRLTVTAPRGPAGAYLLELHAGGHRYTTPFVVRSARRRRVLVVLPAITWQGANPVDDDGDGFPEDLRAGTAAPLARGFAGDGLPTGFQARVAPLLADLDRRRRRYDVTTDLALATGRGPRLVGHRGVVLAGDAVWLPAEVQRSLRRYAQRGGRVLALGTGSLRRTVDLAGGRLSDPSPRAARDVFGVRLGPPRRARVTLTPVRDELGLFAGLSAPLSGFDVFQPTREVGAGSRIVSEAATPGGEPVLVALTLGRGLVVRTGLPQWSRRLARRGAPGQIMRRIWATLSR